MEFILLRILKGRLSIRTGDLSLYIQEPTQDLMYESMNVYEDIYERAYVEGAYVESELQDFLRDYDLWDATKEDRLGRLKKDIDELKHRAFKSFFKKTELKNIKHQLRNTENEIGKLLMEKTQYDYLTCKGIAEYARWNWIIEKSVYYDSGERYVGLEVSLKFLTSHYEGSAITSTQFRAVAKMGDWRSMWSLSKRGETLFGRPATQLTRDQLLLSSFSAMYDSVYESPDAPTEEIIEDDDCLDGWFIEQKRKGEELKKEQQTTIVAPGNGEVFVMAASQEEARDIYKLNNPQAQARIQSREREIMEKGIIKNDLEFSDVRRDLTIEQNKHFADKLRGKK